jgi:DNA processing protein
LLSRFGSATAVLNAKPTDFREVRGISPEIASAIRSDIAFPAAEKMLQRATDLGQIVLVPTDAQFPPALRVIPDPPPVLFTLGHLVAFERPAVAIVGSRDHSNYGADVARSLGRFAANAGIAVVSGMARGLDAMAQGAAIEVGGVSIGVLGTGADQVYPAENRVLFDRIREHGLLVSEYPPGTRPGMGTFPQRNRIISGLAQALVVVEATEGSGTLITVTCALEQGREVLAVPGPITSSTSRGTNRLIRDGATPLLCAEDLLAAFGAIVPPAAKGPMPAPPCNLSPDEALVLNALSCEARQVDEIAEQVGLPIGRLLAVLLGLELGGLAEQSSGALYRRRC